MASWADKARMNSPKPLPTLMPQPSSTEYQQGGRITAPLSSSSSSSVTSSLYADHHGNANSRNRPGSAKRGEGLSLLTPVGQIPLDIWHVILSFCPHTTVLRTGHTCVLLRSLSLKPFIWQQLKDSFSVHFELDVGHAIPALEFTYPVGMSSTVVKKKNSTRGGGNFSAFVTEENESAAEFIRFIRFLSKSEHRMWHLKEFTQNFDPIRSNSIRFGYVPSYDPSLPSPTSITTANFNLTITAVERSRGPYLTPSDISTVFSHQAANAMSVCRLETNDVTSMYSEGLLTQIKRSLSASATLHRDLGQALVAASLIEISFTEAMQCLKNYSSKRGGGGGGGGGGQGGGNAFAFAPNETASLLEMLLDDVTIDEHETRYFAFRQLSTETNIALLYVDPILAIVIAAGR